MHAHVIHGRSGVGVLLALVFCVMGVSRPAVGQQWPAYGADKAGTKYSPLDQINRDTVHDLQVVWRQSTIPDAVRQGNTTRAPAHSQNTPLMVDGLLYVSTGLGTVTALDATTGEVVWYDAVPEGGQRPGSASRGVAYWTDGQDARVIAVMGSSLVALNAKTGARYADFGEGGQVDLGTGFSDPRGHSFTWGSAPIVVNDVIIVGSHVRDMASAFGLAMKKMPAGDVRGVDVRSGEQLWVFQPIPRVGQPLCKGGHIQSSGTSPEYRSRQSHPEEI